LVIPKPNNDNKESLTPHSLNRKQEAKMLLNYTAKYSKIDSGYMGQLVEWPEVVTEGKDIEECRMMLRDALNEMLLAYKQQRKEIPVAGALIEQVPIEVQDVYQTA
jgi:predicted RNase H-like HicB family nuclease